MGNCWGKQKKQPIQKPDHFSQTQLQLLIQTSSLETDKQQIRKIIQKLDMDIKNLKEEINRLQINGQHGNAQIKKQGLFVYNLDLKIAEILIRDYALSYGLISNIQMLAEKTLMNADLFDNLNEVAIQIHEQQQVQYPKLNNFMKNHQQLLLDINRLITQYNDEVNNILQKISNDIGVGQQVDKRLTEIKAKEQNERNLKISQLQQRIKYLDLQILRNCKENQNLCKYTEKLNKIIEKQQYEYEISQTHIKGLDNLVSQYKAMDEQRKKDYRFLQNNYNLQQHQIENKDKMITEFIDLKIKLKNQVVELQRQMTEWQQQVQNAEKKYEADIKEVQIQLENELRKQENNAKLLRRQKYQIDGQEAKINELNQALNEYRQFTSSQTQYIDKLFNDFKEIKQELQEVQKQYQQLLVEKEIIYENKQTQTDNQICHHQFELLIRQKELIVLQQQLADGQVNLDSLADKVQQQSNQIIQLQNKKQQIQQQLLRGESERRKEQQTIVQLNSNILEYHERTQQLTDCKLIHMNQIEQLQKQVKNTEKQLTIELKNKQLDFELQQQKVSNKVQQQSNQIVQLQIEKQQIQQQLFREESQRRKEQQTIVQLNSNILEYQERTQKLTDFQIIHMNQIEQLQKHVKNIEKQLTIELKNKQLDFELQQQNLSQDERLYNKQLRDEQKAHDYRQTMSLLESEDPSLSTENVLKQDFSHIKDLMQFQDRAQVRPAAVFNAFDERPVISNRQNMFDERPIENTPQYNAFDEKPIKSSKPKSSSKQEISDVENIQEKVVKPKPFLKKGSSQQRLSNAKVLADVPKQQKQQIPKKDNTNLNQKSKTPTKKSKTETNQNKKQAQ